MAILRKNRKASGMSSYSRAIELVYCARKETKKEIERALFTNDFFFYHDALSLLAAKDFAQWIKDNDHCCF